MSTESPAATSTIDLNDPSLITIRPDDPTGDDRKPKAPHFYRQDAAGRWHLVEWLAARLAEHDKGKVQREFADTLLGFGMEMASRADAAAGCGNSWFPYKGCESVLPNGKKHQVELAKSECYMPFCPTHQEATERLDYFLYRDSGDLMAAAADVVEACVRRGRNPIVARIRLTITLPPSSTFTYAEVRRNQENIHSALARWRDRIVREHDIPSYLYGMVVSDSPYPRKAELNVLYIGPDIPSQSFRDYWKAAAGPQARFWHMRRTVTLHDATHEQDNFEGMIESELQHIFTLPWWIREADGKTRALLQFAFQRYHMIRQVGYFYGYKQKPETISEQEANDLMEQALLVSDEQFNELCNVPVHEGSACIHCHQPLILLHGRGSGHLAEFHDTYDHVGLHYSRRRPEHKHNTVSMCGEEWRRYQQRKAFLSAPTTSPPH